MPQALKPCCCEWPGQCLALLHSQCTSCQRCAPCFTKASAGFRECLGLELRSQIGKPFKLFLYVTPLLKEKFTPFWARALGS